MFATKTFTRIALRAAVLAAIALLVWSFLARPSGAHGPKVVYQVKPYDTLWSIAAAHSGGDTRDTVWQIEHVNHLNGTDITPGERLVLP